MNANFIQTFTRKLRLSNPWNYKVPLLLSFPYFFLVTGNVSTLLATLSFFAAIVTSVGFAGFGYLTNDLSDRKSDLLVGKSNSAHQLGAQRSYGLLILFLLMAILPWMYLPVDEVSSILLAIELVLFVIYAFPPFRLKERGIPGIIADAAYAHIVPAVLASWTFYLVGGKVYPDFSFFLVLLVLWQGVSGVRNIFYHQIKDYENDLRSETVTYVGTIGRERAVSHVIRFLIPLELTLFVVFIAFLNMDIAFLWWVILLVWILAVYQFLEKKNDLTEAKYKHFTNLFLDQIYNEWLPVLILLAAISQPFDVRYILLVHLLLFRNPLKRFYKFVGKSRLINSFGRLDEWKKGIIHFTLFVIVFIAFLGFLSWFLRYQLTAY